MSMQMVMVLSFLYLGINNDLNSYTHTREWGLMGILFLDLDRIWVIFLAGKYTDYSCMVFSFTGAVPTVTAKIIGDVSFTRDSFSHFRPDCINNK